ncbi:pyridine nucleotide-disulfide oxidoreductase [Cobetia sp. UCD-24C]|uniref:pyridine nucleotide-disulfide oxidoreductase n=1 Tax=Cobetia sp. UCD-24C TaxID=1716176 RepID=UPI000AE76048|nr:pyridine nucleotide-disulfide oxidoreductase [Cobetia sp. UCD-24C]
MKDLSRITGYGCIVAGVGPAGMGFLFNALKTGQITTLARHGLLILDAGGTHAGGKLGAGRLGEYRITANSVGDVFLDCLRDPALADVLAPLEGEPCLERIRADPYSSPRLDEIGELLEAASALVLAHITALPGVEMWCGTSLDTLRYLDGTSILTLSHEPEVAQRTTRLRTDNLVLNLGGQQCPERLIQSLNRQGLTPSRRARIYSGDELLRMPPGQLRSLLLPRLRRGGRVCVVGGSHSAFSMLDVLADALRNTRVKEITLLHRSPIRLFFENAEEARAAGYHYDAERDVCPISGRINRSGGLRYRALAIGQEILATGRIEECAMDIQLVQTGPGSAQRLELASEVLADAPIVVQCNGYQPILPTISDAHHQPITLREVNGGLDSDANGNPCDIHGQRLAGLYMFGLGAGLAVDPTLGSEASFDGRIYGVWQFHNHASLPALHAIIARNASDDALGSDTAHSVGQVIASDRGMASESGSGMTIDKTSDKTSANSVVSEKASADSLAQASEAEDFSSALKVLSDSLGLQQKSRMA